MRDDEQLTIRSSRTRRQARNIMRTYLNTKLSRGSSLADAGKKLDILEFELFKDQ
jgi:hypothetical protein